MNDEQLRLHEPRMTVGEAYERSLNRLADWLGEAGGLDDLELLEILQGLIPPLTFQHLCDMLERCEVHICDFRICADDLDASCPTGAEAIRLAGMDRLMGQGVQAEADFALCAGCGGCHPGETCRPTHEEFWPL